MPELSNPRHERYAQELAKGKTADEAYRLAGYSENRGNATRLKANESVLKRVAELLGKGAELAAVTVESILDELEGARQLALTLKQPATMVSASFNKAKVAGIIIDKREDVTPRRSLEQIDARITQLLDAAGARRTPQPPGRPAADDSGNATVSDVPGHGAA
jgi:phage terminase small subunit